MEVTKFKKILQEVFRKYGINLSLDMCLRVSIELIMEVGNYFRLNPREVLETGFLAVRKSSNRYNILDVRMRKNSRKKLYSFRDLYEYYSKGIKDKEEILNMMKEHLEGITEQGSIE